jgi:hypothetical protein
MERATARAAGPLDGHATGVAGRNEPRTNPKEGKTA